MVYKAFLVEDEIVTREGIRDRVKWQDSGFAFCGEASDGEMALPLIQAAQPQVVITDIKMPFMDGLQLSKILRERMPGVKIVILSGHDEFEYAQQAIEIGVTEYLLKPVTVNDLNRVLHKLAAQLDAEQKELQARQRLEAQVAESQALLREKLLLRLVVGAISPSQALEQSQSLGMDLVARCYQVLLIKAELGDRSEQFDYAEYKEILKSVSKLADDDPDIFLLQKDWEELVLLLKSNAPEFLAEGRQRLAQSIHDLAAKTRYRLQIGSGQVKNRLTDIHQSFVEALMSLQARPGESASFPEELLAMDRTALEQFLRCGTMAEFDSFFASCLQPIGERVLRMPYVRHYILVEIVLSAARLIGELGGDVAETIPQLNALALVSAEMTTIEQLKERAFGILHKALAFRDGPHKSPYRGLVQQAREYIALHYDKSDLSLGDVAAQVNLSPSHFSAIFSQEAGQNFKECLTEFRIQKAKELLRTSQLKTAEIAYRVGYNDAHYFSSVFHKVTGLTPTEFRAQAYRSQL